jgi:hypoxanthine phosphoribosyltransferase
VTEPRESLTYEAFGTASRELAGLVAGDGFEPDLVLAIARGGLFLGGALGYALEVKTASPTPGRPSSWSATSAPATSPRSGRR